MVLGLTRNLTRPRFHSPWLLLIKSTSRPGVAMRTCGRFFSSMAWCIMSIPPTMTAECRLTAAPSTRNCSEIWKASSLCTGGRTGSVPNLVPSQAHGGGTRERTESGSGRSRRNRTGLSRAPAGLATRMRWSFRNRFGRIRYSRRLFIKEEMMADEHDRHSCAGKDPDMDSAYL